MLFALSANPSLLAEPDRPLLDLDRLKIPQWADRGDLLTSIVTPTTLVADQLHSILRINDTEYSNLLSLDIDSEIETSNQAPEQRSKFLDLPQEILDLVYRTIFPEIDASSTINEQQTSRNFIRDEDKLPLLSVGHMHDRYTAMSLLLACKKTHNDITLWIYGFKTFTFLSLRAARKMAVKLGRPRVHLLRKIELFDRWGSSDNLASISGLIKLIHQLRCLERLDLQWFNRGTKDRKGEYIDHDWTPTQLAAAETVLQASSNLTTAYHRDLYSRMRFCGAHHRKDRDEEKVNIQL